MDALQLIDRLKVRGVELQADGDRLRFRPADALTPEEVEALCQHKAEVLKLLQGWHPDAPAPWYAGRGMEPPLSATPDGQRAIALWERLERPPLRIAGLPGTITDLRKWLRWEHHPATLTAVVRELRIMVERMAAR